MISSWKSLSGQVNAHPKVVLFFHHVKREETGTELKPKLLTWETDGSCSKPVEVPSRSQTSSPSVEIGGGGGPLSW